MLVYVSLLGETGGVVVSVTPGTPGPVTLCHQ